MAVQAQQFPTCGSLDWMESGFGHNYCFNVQQQLRQLQQQQQQQQCSIQPLQIQQQQQRNQNLCFDNSLPVSFNSLKNNSNQLSMASCQRMAAHEEKQSQEIDNYIRLQNERLRLFLQEQSKQHCAMLLNRIESKFMPILRQKEEQIAQAAKRKLQLEDSMKRLEMENQAWLRVAQEKEAMVMSLNNTMEQLRERNMCCFNNGSAEDAESCCDMTNREEKVEETEQRNRAFVAENVNEDDRAGKMTMACKGCNSRNSCVLFLPCRHLCSCRACEAFLDFCPVCQTAKKASIEALMV